MVTELLALPFLGVLVMQAVAARLSAAMQQLQHAAASCQPEPSLCEQQHARGADGMASSSATRSDNLSMQELAHVHAGLPATLALLVRHEHM